MKSEEGEKRGKSLESGAPVKTARRRWIVVWSVAAALLMAFGVVWVWAMDMRESIKPPPVETPSPAVSADPEEVPEVTARSMTTPALADDGRRPGVYTVILGGTDLNDYHTDTLMVATLDSVNHTLDVLSIPRDTQVDVSWSTKKINAAWGVGEGDVTLLSDLLRTVIGFRPDCHVVVSLEGFVELIDALGGVDFDVPIRMSHRDSNRNLRISLEAGLQHLNGAQALQLVRFRSYFEGDPRRVQMQQAFLTEVVRQTLSLGSLFKIPEFVSIAQENVQSDLTLGSMIWFLRELMALQENDITFHTLPGDPDGWYQGLNYFLVDPEETAALVNAYINPYVEPITADTLSVPHFNDGIRPRR